MLGFIDTKKDTNFTLKNEITISFVRKPISIMLKIKFTSSYLVITRKDLVITRKLSRNYEKRSRNYEKIIS